MNLEAFKIFKLSVAIYKKKISKYFYVLNGNKKKVLRKPQILFLCNLKFFSYVMSIPNLKKLLIGWYYYNNFPLTEKPVP